jgi:predicted transcriptional regulator
MADGMIGRRMTDENTSGVLPAGGKHRRRVGPPRRPEHRDKPLDPDPVTIELSKAQVDQVIRAAGEGGTMSVLLSALKDPQWTLAVDSDEWSYPVQMEDRRLSRSLLSGLLVLSCFSAEGGSLGIAELARRLDMNTSTTHRYVTTLLAVGLLERDPTTRRYRLAA